MRASILDSPMWGTFLTASAAAALSALCFACAPEPEWAGSIEERDGVTYVTNSEAGLWQGAEEPPLRFELEQAFGSDGEPLEAMLGEPFRLAFDVDSEGNVDGKLYTLASEPFPQVRRYRVVIEAS